MAAGNEDGTSGRRWLQFVAPALLVLLYLPTLSYPFLWDDFAFLADNEALRSTSNVPLFFSDYKTMASSPEVNPGIYRPLRNVLWAFEYPLWKDWPGGYHLVNVLLHALNTFLLWWLSVGLLAGLGREAARFGAFAAALLWAAHPLLTEAVAWVKAGDDLLVATFCLAGGIAALRLGRNHRENSSVAPGGKRLWLMAALVLCHLGALSSKETGVVYPAVVLVLFWAARRLRDQPLFGTRSARRGIATLLAVGFLLDLLYLLVRGRVVGSLAQVTEPLAPWADLLWTQLRATARGLWLVVWPKELLADYSGYRVSTETGVVEIASLVLVGGLLLAAVLASKRAPVVTAGIGIWFVGILPVSNLVPTMQFLAERFLYLPLVGPALIVGWAAARGWGETEAGLTVRRRRLLLGILLVAALLMARTSTRVGVWAGEVELFGATARQSPGSVRAQANYALALFYRGRYAECLDTLSVVRRLDPEHDVLDDLEEDARYLARNGPRIESMLQTVDREPNNLAAKLELGELAGRARREGTARLMFEQVIDTRPEDWRAWAGLAWVEALAGDGQAAQAAIERARTLAGGDFEAASALSARERRVTAQLGRATNSAWRGSAAANRR